MIVTKVQIRPKLNGVVFPAPQTSPAKSAKSVKSATIAASVLEGQALQDQIRERAFQIYEKRGSKPGHDIQDWLRAERQILLFAAR